MNKNKVLKIVAGSLAGVALGGALIYFNFVDNTPESTLEIWDETPDFTLQTYYVEDGQFQTGGEEFTMSKQDKVTIINFWATYCAPCIAEMPYFSRLQENYPDYVDVVIVTGETAKGGYEGLCDWMNKQNAPVVYDKYKRWTDYAFTFGFYDVAQNDVYANYGFTGAMPSTAIVDENGIVRYLEGGSMDYKKLETEVRKVLPAGVEPLYPDEFEEITVTVKKNWWKENALGITFLAVSTLALGGAIVVSAVGSIKDKKKKNKK
ncbi:MAG: TlpA family protein disulfide reductase [Clostridia bacterium]|nr:TlpA family protein disulfide reductase [Clostridia bacterium]